MLPEKPAVMVNAFTSTSSVCQPVSLHLVGQQHFGIGVAA